MKDKEKALKARDYDKGRGSGRGPITQPGPMPRPAIPRDIGLGNGPRGLPPKGPGTTPLGMEPAKGFGNPIVKGVNATPQTSTGLNQGLPAPTGPYAGKVVTDPNVKSMAMKKGGKVKSTSSYKSGGSVSSASKRGDGCAQRGKTKGRMV